MSQPDSVEQLRADILTWERPPQYARVKWVHRLETLFAAERERYAKLEADYDKLTEMYERALREREDGP